MGSRKRRLAVNNPPYNAKNHVPLQAILGVYQYHLQPTVLPLMNTCIRRGGLFNLTWRDVDLVGKRITVVGNASKAVQTHISLLKMKLFKH